MARSPKQGGPRTYEVGYRKPPAHSRFKKGVSGNPGGRPQGITPGRAKKLALKRHIGGGEKGIGPHDLLSAVREEFKENEDLPNTTNPDDWAKISGKKGERIVYVRTLVGESKRAERRSIERLQTGQYL